MCIFNFKKFIQSKTHLTNIPAVSAQITEIRSIGPERLCCPYLTHVVSQEAAGQLFWPAGVSLGFVLCCTIMSNDSESFYDQVFRSHITGCVKNWAYLGLCHATQVVVNQGRRWFETQRNQILAEHLKEVRKALKVWRHNLKRDTFSLLQDFCSQSAAPLLGREG